MSSVDLTRLAEAVRGQHTRGGDPTRPALWRWFPLSSRRRFSQLAELLAEHPELRASERLRFLRAYLGGAPGREELRKAWIGVRDQYLARRRTLGRQAIRNAFTASPALANEGSTWWVRSREQAAVIRLTLDTPQCRTIWALCHVFEQLGLPALRPVRLEAGFIELLAPELDENAMDFHAAVTRARRRFTPYGRFIRDPQWALTPTGAVLITPSAFRLSL